MSRIFSGTKWDRPPMCDRCGQPESECACPPLPPPAPVRLAPETQTARLKIEKRAKGKVVTVVANLDPQGNDLPALAATLKAKCGAGGTVKDGAIELQGDHLAAAERALQAIGYKTRTDNKRS
jgi:translation initiation factor 1